MLQPEAHEAHLFLIDDVNFDHLIKVLPDFSIVWLIFGFLLQLIKTPQGDVL